MEDPARGSAFQLTPQSGTWEKKRMSGSPCSAHQHCFGIAEWRLSYELSSATLCNIIALCGKLKYDAPVKSPRYLKMMSDSKTAMLRKRLCPQRPAWQGNGVPVSPWPGNTCLHSPALYVCACVRIVRAHSAVRMQSPALPHDSFLSPLSEEKGKRETG